MRHTKLSSRLVNSWIGAQLSGVANPEQGTRDVSGLPAKTWTKIRPVGMVHRERESELLAFEGGWEWVQTEMVRVWRSTPVETRATLAKKTCKPTIHYRS